MNKPVTIQYRNIIRVVDASGFNQCFGQATFSRMRHPGENESYTVEADSGGMKKNVFPRRLFSDHHVYEGTNQMLRIR